MEQEQEKELQEITEWLVLMGKNREWLANEIGVSLPTVNGWYSPASRRPVPKPTLRLIQMLMRDVHLGEPRFTIFESKRVIKAMDAADCVSFGDFARDAVNAKVKTLLQPNLEVEPALPRVADAPSDYPARR